MLDTRLIFKKRYTNSRALIIGINEYKNVNPLAYAVSDAEAIHEVLITDLHFPAENITCLLDEAATRGNILKEYLKYMKICEDADERVLVFFAGHGHTIAGYRGDVGYLVPVDADLDDFSTLIRWDELTRNSFQIRAKHMLFIMDACYSGLALTRSSSAGSTRFLNDMMLRTSRQVITAGKANEEVSDAGGPLPDHSVFTGHLIEGLKGNAATEHGVITANGLMAYVYNKVANDEGSHQTPHYGYFDGDGDFILYKPELPVEESENKDIDYLVSVPYTEDVLPEAVSENKVKTVKKLLANEASNIELHDFVIDEVKQFLAKTSEDHFNPDDWFVSDEEIINKITKYEELVKDLASIVSCVAYWGKPIHKTVLQKIFARSVDRLEARGGYTLLLALRWYPLLVEFYCAGIAAVNGGRYDNLASIFTTKIPFSATQKNYDSLVKTMADQILEFNRASLFNKIPEYKNYFSPLSEHFYKILQPILDDALFIGKSYETSFDEFEILFALMAADAYKQEEGHVWFPAGRFAYKYRSSDNPLIRVMINGAEIMKSDWEPLQAGLFNGDYQRFSDVAKEVVDHVKSLRRW